MEKERSSTAVKLPKRRVRLQASRQGEMGRGEMEEVSVGMVGLGWSVSGA
jgi:hypothetical protein